VAGFCEPCAWFRLTCELEFFVCRVIQKLKRAYVVLCYDEFNYISNLKYGINLGFGEKIIANLLYYFYSFSFMFIFIPFIFRCSLCFCSSLITLNTVATIGKRGRYKPAFAIVIYLTLFAAV